MVEKKLDTSFRLLTAHDIRTDESMARLDVVMGLEEPLPKSKIGGGRRVTQVHADFPVRDGFLLLPISGIESGVTIQCNAGDLVAAFRALADRVEDWASQRA